MTSLDDIINLYYPAALSAYGKVPLPLSLGLTYTQPIVSCDPKDQSRPCFGFTGVLPDGSTLVSFRGTETADEWLSDFNALPVAFDGAKVHAGFAGVYRALSWVCQQNPKKLRITGHSLGAALALLFSYKYGLYQDTEVVTFAGPRVFVGNGVYPGMSTTRVTNRWDVVPHVPITELPPLDYQHVGREVKVDGGFTPDLHTAHSLPLSYLPGLQRLVKP